MNEQNETPKRRPGRPRLSEEEKARRKAEREAGKPTAPKRNTIGRPPWTEEQKQRYKEAHWAEDKNFRVRTNYAKDKEEFGSAKAAREARKTMSREEKMAIRARRVKETWARKAEAKNAEREALVAENPEKTKEELGIPSYWMTEAEKEKERQEKANKVLLRTARVALDLPPINILDPEQVQKRIFEYLDFCEANDKLPTQIGMANWLGIESETLYSWRKGNTRSTTHTPVVNKVVALMEEILVEKLSEQKGNPANIIFLLKNMFGYRDQQDVVVQAPKSPIKEMSDDDIAKWYLDDGKTVETSFADEQNGQK